MEGGGAAGMGGVSIRDADELNAIIHLWLDGGHRSFMRGTNKR